jgi:hypothetical protein
MSKSRTLLLAAVTALAVMLIGGAGPATAQAATPLTQTVAMTGKAKNGKRFTGTYAIDRFIRRGGQTYAVGTLKGRRVKREDVRIPVDLARAAQASQILPTPNACQILNLTLQPIDINLLGLRVRTSRIDLRIEGVPGGGQLVGNLLCGLLGILDPQGGAGATPSQLTQVLNALLALVPRTA